MNVFTAIGRVGRDAVLRHTQGGEPVLGFPLAVDAGYGDRKVTTWVDCSVWGKRAEALSERIAKGDRLGVVGELSHKEKDGKVYVTLRVSEVTLLTVREEVPAKPAPKAPPKPPSQPDPLDDDIPFN